MAKQYAMAVSYEVVEGDGTRLWDGEIAYHGLASEQLVACERLVQDLVGQLKAVTANGGTERPIPDRTGADGGLAGEE